MQCATISPQATVAFIHGDDTELIHDPQMKFASAVSEPQMQFAPAVSEPQMQFESAVPEPINEIIDERKVSGLSCYHEGGSTINKIVMIDITYMRGGQFPREERKREKKYRQVQKHRTASHQHWYQTASQTPLVCLTVTCLMSALLLHLLCAASIPVSICLFPLDSIAVCSCVFCCCVHRCVCRLSQHCHHHHHHH